MKRFYAVCITALAVSVGLSSVVPETRAHASTLTPVANPSNAQVTFRGEFCATEVRTGTGQAFICLLNPYFVFEVDPVINMYVPELCVHPDNVYFNGVRMEEYYDGENIETIVNTGVNAKFQLFDTFDNLHLDAPAVVIPRETPLDVAASFTIGTTNNTRSNCNFDYWGNNAEFIRIRILLGSMTGVWLNNAGSIGQFLNTLVIQKPVPSGATVREVITSNVNLSANFLHESRWETKPSWQQFLLMGAKEGPLFVRGNNNHNGSNVSIENGIPTTNTGSTGDSTWDIVPGDGYIPPTEPGVPSEVEPGPGFIGYLEDIIDGLASGPIWLWEQAEEFFSDPMQKISDIFGAIVNLPGQIWEAFSSSIGSIIDFLGDILEAIGDGFSAVIDFIAAVPGIIYNAITSALSWLFLPSESGLLEAQNIFDDAVEDSLVGDALGAFDGFISQIEAAGADPQCMGIPVQFTMDFGAMGEVDEEIGYLLAACDEPTASVAAGVKMIISAGLLISTAIVSSRYIAAVIGFVPFGAIIQTNTRETRETVSS